MKNRQIKHQVQLDPDQRAAITLIKNHSSAFVQRLVVMLLLLTTLLSFPQRASAQNLGIIAVTGLEGAQLRETPGGTVTQIIGVGQTVTVTGRTATHDWLFATLADEETGWIAVDELLIFGSDRLPVVDAVGSNNLSENAGTMASEPAAEESTVALTTTIAVSTSESTVSMAVVGEPVTDDLSMVADSTLTGRVTVRNSRLNIRSGPATTYPIVGKAQPAQTLTLLGRSTAGDWFQIQFETGAQTEAGSAFFGWVASRYVEAAGDLMTLPVVEAISVAPALVETEQEAPMQPTHTISVATQPADTESRATNSSARTVMGSGGTTGLTGTLVFQSSPGDMIYAYQLETGALWPLTNGFDPAISPDGQSVAFVREGGENGVYLINIDGSNERAIFTGRARLSSPKWSPDGNWILFTRSDEYSECVNLGPGGCQDLNALPPNVPTDDLKVSKEYEYNLAAVDTNGDHYHDIAALESARVADWNEAGIVYQSSAGLQITADGEGAENRLLLFIPLQPPHEDPDWQPNGGKVAFVQHHGNHYEIYTINPDGSGMTALTRPVTSLVDEMPNNVAPAWSPDGQHIVFLSNRDAENEAGAWRIWIMDADGSRQRALPIDVTINYAYGNEQAVSWGL